MDFNAVSLLDLGINDTHKSMNLIHLTQLMSLHYLVKVKTSEIVFGFASLYRMSF